MESSRASARGAGSPRADGDAAALSGRQVGARKPARGKAVRVAALRPAATGAAGRRQRGTVRANAISSGGREAGRRGAGRGKGRDRRRKVAGGTGAFSYERKTQAFRYGYILGREDALAGALCAEGRLHRALNRRWAERLRHWEGSRRNWSRYRSMSEGYLHGFFVGRKEAVPDWVLSPVEQSIAVVITAMNEEATIGRTIREAVRLGADEVIVVVNGSTDRTYERASQHAEAKIVHYPHPLGHDVGRAVGARLATADIVLFLDGDIPIRAERLVAFVHAVSRGMDIALNDISPYLGSFSRRDQVTQVKQFLNLSLGRPDLKANSLTAVPHAMSRAALEALGPELLMVPPKAQAAALLQGLSVGAPASVDVIRRNKRRKGNQGALNRVARLIIGDHLEALKLAGEKAGARLCFPDTQRARITGGGAAEHERETAEHHHPEL
ncbi:MULTISPECIES: glycosyltransferase family A protein [unclassified Paenibacillus]|uniref:glycosyltransferase family 2 protein n=1 Tax=unclassified Paenibacillus TaxID=185978 RepID=UPI00210CD797|nr:MULTISPECIES: glycosyltransferase family A protein [unclassified Paenibacillus]